MKISAQILSIPPYVSTSWKNIASLHLEYISSQDVLVITLHSGVRIEIPALPVVLIEEIFSAHRHHLEQEEVKARPGKSSSLEVFSMLNPLLHDPSLSDTPALPEELLSKIADMAKNMGLSDHEAIPHPERECRCMRCQIARALQSALNTHTEEAPLEEEEVTDADLSFASWKVSKEHDKLYIVSHPEEDEHYHVHLGEQIGCTCGQTGCEHIRAVLKT